VIASSKRSRLPLMIVICASSSMAISREGAPSVGRHATPRSMGLRRQRPRTSPRWGQGPAGGGHGLAVADRSRGSDRGVSRPRRSLAHAYLGHGRVVALGAPFASVALPHAVGGRGPTGG
jgi:hypothetical protein